MINKKTNKLIKLIKNLSIKLIINKILFGRLKFMIKWNYKLIQLIVNLNHKKEQKLIKYSKNMNMKLINFNKLKKM